MKPRIPFRTSRRYQLPNHQRFFGPTIDLAVSVYRLLLTLSASVQQPMLSRFSLRSTFQPKRLQRTFHPSLRASALDHGPDACAQLYQRKLKSGELREDQLQARVQLGFPSGWCMRWRPLIHVHSSCASHVTTYGCSHSDSHLGS